MYYYSVGRIFKADVKLNRSIIARSILLLRNVEILPYAVWKTSYVDNNKVQITSRQAAWLIKLYGGDISIMEKL